MRAPHSARCGEILFGRWRYAVLVTKREQREAAAILDRLARVVANGEITAPSGFVGRLEGAAATLKVMRRAPDRKGQGRRL